MTRAYLQAKINDLVDDGKAGQVLLEDIKKWLKTQGMTDEEITRLSTDFCTYEGLEWLANQD